MQKKGLTEEDFNLTIFLTEQIVPKKNSHMIRRRGRYGKFFIGKTEKQISSQSLLHIQALDSWTKRRLGQDPPFFDLKTEVHLKVLFAYNSHADTIGLLETVLDSLEGVIYKNDKVVKHCTYDMLPKNEPVGWTAKITLVRVAYL